MVMVQRSWCMMNRINDNKEKKWKMKDREDEETRTEQG